MFGSVFPDEKIRRLPGFDLQKWRERQPGYSKLMARGRKRRSKSRSSC
jgi:hypothetical protein